jgi:hypothetical protein
MSMRGRGSLKKATQKIGKFLRGLVAWFNLRFRLSPKKTEIKYIGW